MLEGLKCQSNECIDGLVSINSMKCNTCDQKFSMDSLELFKMQQSNLEKKIKENPNPSGQLFNELYKLRSDFLFKSNSKLIELTLSLMNFSIQTREWNEAKKYASRLTWHYEKLYPENWPLLGLQYFLNAKIEWFLQQTDSAVSLLKKGKKLILFIYLFIDRVIAFNDCFFFFCLKKKHSCLCFGD